MIKRSIAVGLLLAASATATFAGPPVRKGHLVEKVSPDIPVSGVYLVAVMSGAEPTRANPDRFFVWIPPKKNAVLCVNVRSVDGAYSARVSFDISNTETGRYALPFGSAEREHLRTYTPGELVVDGRVGDECDRPERLTQVPMAWDQQTAEAGSVLIFINGDGQDAVLQLPDRTGDNVTSVPCQSVNSPKPRRIYSILCSFQPTKQMDLASAWLELRRFGRVSAREPLAVSLPGQ